MLIPVRRPANRVAPAAGRCEGVHWRVARLVAALLVGFGIVWIAGCSSNGGYYQDDGPPRRHNVDLSKVADAVPRNEPLSRTGNRPYKVFGKRYKPMQSARGYRQRGVASWYGRQFHGRRTSSGERYDMFAMTAAHRTLPIPSYVRVTNLRNDKSVVVKVNDRGPFLHNRVIDLSYAAAYKLGIVATGTGLVEVTAVFADSAGQRRAAPTRVRAVSRPGVYVQIGAFSLARNAEVMRRRLQRDALTPVVISGNRDTLHRVRIGPMGSVKEADEMARRAAAMGYDVDIVVD